MSDPQFDIVLKGILAGFEPQQVHADFATLFSLDPAKVQALFSAKRAVLKSRINRETADKYITRLAKIGVDAVAEEIAVPAAAEPLTLVPVENSATAEAPAANVDNPDPASAEQSFGPTANTYESPSTARRTLRFSFTGKGFEYFKIWIVNILLSIVTLGIYSAWAKVRNKQYFYGNTQIDATSFEYTAEPIKILKGRLIAFALYIGVAFANHASPFLSLLMAALILVFLPWIIVNSLKFNARHTSYRNIPFRFNGTIRGALAAFIGWPILGLLSIGILFPFVWKKQAQYITNNHSYGTEPFRFDVAVKEYYKMLFIVIGASVAFMVVFFLLLGGSAMAIFKQGETFNPASLLTIIPILVGYVVFYFGLGAYIMVSLANIHVSNTKLQQHQFVSNWTTASYLGLILVNTIGIVLTLGLFIPFAKVRTAAYKAAHTQLVVSGDLDGFIANELERSNSLAEGVHDIFDIDISL